MHEWTRVQTSTPKLFCFVPSLLREFLRFKMKVIDVLPWHQAVYFSISGPVEEMWQTSGKSLITLPVAF